MARPEKTTITRRTMVQGLAAAGIAPLIDTGCTDPCLSVFELILWHFMGDSHNKADFFANYEQRGKDCAEQRRQEQEKQKQNEENLKRSLDAYNDLVRKGQAPPLGGPRPATRVPSGGTLHMDDATIRAAVVTARDRVWVLDTYGNSRLRVLASDPIRQIADLPLEGGPKAIALSPDKATLYVTRNPLAQTPGILAVDTQTRAVTMPFTDFPTDAFPNAIGITPDGSRLLVWADKFNGTSALYVIDVAARRTLRAVDLSGRKMSDMVFTPDSQLCFCLRESNFGIYQPWAFDIQAMEFTAQVQVNSSNPKLAISRTGDRLYVSHARVEPFDTTTRPIGLAAIDTSSLAITGYIPYTNDLVSSPARLITGLYSHPLQNLLFATFQDETGYYTFDPARRLVEGPFVPDTADAFAENYVLALGAF